MNSLFYDPQEFVNTLADNYDTPLFIAGIDVADNNELSEFIQNYAPQVNCRIALIDCNSQCFNGCNLRFYEFLIAYRGANFNITVPSLQEYKTSVYDAIKHLEGREIVAADNEDFDSYLILDQNELEAIKNLPNGWTNGTLEKYCGVKIETGRQFKRLAWAVATHLEDDYIAIHPTEQRPLTNGEMQFLQFDEHIEWLQLQEQLFLDSHWLDEDWQSSYKNGQWIGENVNGAWLKRFDINDYHPLWCKQYDAKLVPNYFQMRFHK